MYIDMYTHNSINILIYTLFIYLFTHYICRLMLLSGIDRRKLPGTSSDFTPARVEIPGGL